MKAIFFDKDGTLVDDSKFPQIPRDKIYLDRTVAGMKALQEEYLLFIVSNQGWISTGKLGLDEAKGIFESVVKIYAEHGVKISGYEFCPHKSTDGCKCRKPLTGMLEKLTAEWNIDKEGSYFVGDLPTDVLTGKAFGIKSVVVLNGKTYKGEQPDHIFADVNAFAAYLKNS